MHREKYSKLENNYEYLAGKHNSEKKRSSRYKRKLDAVQEELIASNKKLTVTEVQLEESKRRIVVFEE